MAESARAQWLVVARREFLERVRTAWFVVVTVLGPIGMAGALIIPAWLQSRSFADDVRIAVLDRSGRGLGQRLVEAGRLMWLLNYHIQLVAPDTPEETLRRQVADERIDGYLLLPPDVLDGGAAVYKGINASNLAIEQMVGKLVNDSARHLRAAAHRLDAGQLDRLLAEVRLELVVTDGTGEAGSGRALLYLGYTTMLVLYMAVLLYAVNVLRSVIQEKVSRVVEVVVASVHPRALMLGKLLGVGAVGLVQLAIWGGVAVLLLQFQGQVIGLFGIPPVSIELPRLGLDALALVLLYFLLGYFFFAAVYAAIGAMVNSEQEAQQVQAPVVPVIMLPVLCVHLVASNPRSDVSQLLTLLPVSSPVLMPMRYVLGGASLVEVAISVALLLLATAAVIWLASKIYRVGILVHGQRPSLRELLRWLRHPA
jgi:ABC-2 type transport system permease protein